MKSKEAVERMREIKKFCKFIKKERPYSYSEATYNSIIEAKEIYENFKKGCGEYACYTNQQGVTAFCGEWGHICINCQEIKEIWMIIDCSQNTRKVTK